MNDSLLQFDILEIHEDWDGIVIHVIYPTGARRYLVFPGANTKILDVNTFPINDMIIFPSGNIGRYLALQTLEVYREVKSRIEANGVEGLKLEFTPPEGDSDE